MTSLSFDIFWRDRGARNGIRGLGDDTAAAGRNFDRLKGAAVGAGLVAGAAIFKLGKDSVTAFMEAEQAQAKLAYAFEKFPKLADTNVAAINDLNSALALKTKFDDDAISSGQAVLAQFDLTGKQLTDTTPLLLDYAAATGKELPAAASVVGKALGGNAKALKAIGIEYKSTGNKTQDYANVTELMKQKVGGFAEKEGKTAQGQIAILGNQFGELQETIGSKLVPILMKGAKVLVTMAKWIQRNADVIGPLVGLAASLAAGIWLVQAATKAYAMAQTALNIIMLMSPIGIAVVALVALAAVFIVLWQRSDKFRAIVKRAFEVVKRVVMNWANSFRGDFETAKAALQMFWGWVKNVFGWASRTVNSFKDRFGAAFGRTARAVDVFKDKARSAFRAVIDSILGMMGTAIHAAAKAFGWMPGIGPKLRRAADQFDNFRAAVNKSLSNIHDQKVTVRINTSAAVYGDKGGRYVGSTFVKYAAGGGVWGRGTSTSDSVPALLSHGEHVWTAREVRGAGGHSAVQSMRHAAVRRYAEGGSVDLDGGRTGRAIAGKIQRATLGLGILAARRIDSYFKVMEKALGGGSASGGWRRQWALVHGHFPSARLHSGYRPGSITATGNRSYHGAGRAIDVTPSMAIFNWIRTNFGKNTKELIYSPAGQRQLHNGRNHYYSGVTRSMHFDHVHWAYDQGGIARGPGVFLKRTAKPERVLSPGQTLAFDSLVRMLDRSSTRAAVGGRLVDTGSLVRLDRSITRRAATRNGGGGGGGDADGCIDYERMAEANVRAFVRAGISVKMDGRAVGRVIGTHANMLGRG